MTVSLCACVYSTCDSMYVMCFILLASVAVFVCVCFMSYFLHSELSNVKYELSTKVGNTMMHATYVSTTFPPVHSRRLRCMLCYVLDYQHHTLYDCDICHAKVEVHLLSMPLLCKLVCTLDSSASGQFPRRQNILKEAVYADTYTQVEKCIYSFIFVSC